MLKNIVDIGDILISLNNHVLIDDDLEDVLAFIDMLRCIEIFILRLILF